jgi:anti-sigma regulatory factor (Ser/Thr protein kinase)
MGRGVQAAAVMGQLRTTTRAYARLGLPPADVLEHLDGIVREIGDDQIVTCVYAVFDPDERVLRMANAGHLPPVLVSADGDTRLLHGAADPPLGTGPYNRSQSVIRLAPGDLAVLYTDGLVERRGQDLDTGIDALATLAGRLRERTVDVPERLAQALVPHGADDDVAVLVARVDRLDDDHPLVHRFEASAGAASRARRVVAQHLANRRIPQPVADDAVLATSELVTNAVLHGTGPLELRVRANGAEVLLEMLDRATVQPRKLRPSAEDENGRGLQIVAALAERWGTRGTEDGKSVWCVLSAP